MSWKEHEDKPPVEEIVQADLVEHAGNLLVFAELVSLTGRPKASMMRDEDDEEELVGADPYEIALIKQAKKQDTVPSVKLMVPLSRVVMVRKILPKGVH